MARGRGLAALQALDAQRPAAQQDLGGLDRLEEIQDAAVGRQKPGAVKGLDLGKLLPGPISGVFGSTANPDNPANIAAAERSAATLDAQQEISRIQGQNLFNVAGQGVQMTPESAQQFQQGLSDPGTRAETLGVMNSMRQAPMTAQQSAELRKVNLANNMAELKFQQQSGIGMSPELMTNTAGALFDDRQKQMQPHMTRLANYDQLMSIIGQQSGPASMATLFKFISSMDDSVVRDSEGRLLTSSTGPVGQLANFFNQAQGQGFFDEATADQIKQVATDLARSTWDTANTINADHDKRLAAFSNQFQTPALMNLGVGTGFNPDRQFEKVVRNTNVPKVGEPKAGDQITLEDGSTVTVQ